VPVPVPVPVPEPEHDALGLLAEPAVLGLSAEFEVVLEAAVEG
jgi:hypothetical protein